MFVPCQLDGFSIEADATTVAITKLNACYKQEFTCTTTV
jgi:hypothetical protein